MEILITLVVVTLAAYILFKNFRKASKGGCSCGDCSKNCPMYENKSNKLMIEKNKKNA